MRIKITLKIYLLILIAGFSGACSENFLNQTPRLELPNDLALSTFDGLDRSAAGAYSELCATGWYGAQLIMIADLKGGNGKKGPLNSGRYADEYLWNNSPSSTTGLWTNAYSTIAKANNIINKIDEGFSESGVQLAQINQIKGECLFLRALSYFDLVRTFSQPYSAGRDNIGVPIVTVTENGYPARNSVGEVYDMIVTDLNTSIPLLREINPRKNDGGFASKKAAQALLSKVSLYMGNWQKAADFATIVIQSPRFALFTVNTYTTWDNGGYWGSGGPGSEIIFQVDGSESNTYHGYWEAISFIMDPEGYGDVAASKDLLDLYENGDIRRQLFKEPDYLPGNFWSLKYPGRLGKVPRREYNIPVLRLAEMYLIRAEAILHGASVPGMTALSDYNTIRTHRGLAAVNNNSLVNLQAVYNERRRELCFEGNELFDLARTQRSLIRNDFSGLINRNIPFVPGGSAETNYLWAMPVPQSEVDANVNIVQNPGY
jgi:hypothetical protein